MVLNLLQRYELAKAKHWWKRRFAAHLAPSICSTTKPACPELRSNSTRSVPGRDGPGKL